MPFYCFLWLWRALSLSNNTQRISASVMHVLRTILHAGLGPERILCTIHFRLVGARFKCRYRQQWFERLEIIGRMTGAFSQKRKILLLINLINSFCGPCCCEDCGIWSDVFLNLRGNQYLMVLMLMKNVVWNFGRQINIRFYLFSFNLVVWNSIIKDRIAQANKKNSGYSGTRVTCNFNCLSTTYVKNMLSIKRLQNFIQK